MTLTHIKFQLDYDVALLRKELSYCLKEQWREHFKTSDYAGHWSSISLRSASGQMHDIFAHPSGVYQDTALMDLCPYIKQIVDSWKCEKEAVRLLALAPGSVIKAHKDHRCGYQDGVLRLHIPIVTNPQVHFNLAGEQLQLQEGECWYMDFSQTHSVVNEGNTARVHLVIDAIRNEWTDSLFSAHGYDTKALDQYDEKLKAQIIAELERVGTEASKALIESLKGLRHED